MVVRIKCALVARNDVQFLTSGRSLAYKVPLAVSPKQMFCKKRQLLGIQRRILVVRYLHSMLLVPKVLAMEIWRLDGIAAL